MYTMQEAFDIAARGVIGQGGPSVNDTVSMCLYRDGHGRKCAAGWLMKDRHYLVEFEGMGSNSVYPSIPEWKGLSTTFIGDLQGAHDGAAIQPNNDFVSEYKIRMRYAASRYKLDPKVLDENVSDKVQATFGHTLTPVRELIAA